MAAIATDALVVVDASAALNALLSGPSAADLSRRLAGEVELHAPHLIDIEVLHALRRMVRLGRLTEDRAADVRADLATLTLTRYPHEPLGDRIWELRASLTAYDAAYVALAELLGAVLVTCDAALAAASPSNARIEVHDRG